VIGVLPLPRVQLRVGRGLAASAKAEQRLEGVEWVEPAVEAKGELVEVRLKVLGIDTVMNASQPRLKVRDWPDVDDEPTEPGVRVTLVAR
jgi:hypothetical protein